MTRRRPSKFLTLFNVVFELMADGRLSIEVVGEGGVALYADMTEAEVATLRGLLADRT